MGICWFLKDSAQWRSLVNPLMPSGYYMYHQVYHSTICLHSVFVCFVRILEQAGNLFHLQH